MEFTIHSVAFAITSVIILMAFLYYLLYSGAFCDKLRFDFLTMIVILFFYRLFLPCSFLIGFPLPWMGFFDQVHHFLDVPWIGTLTGYGCLSWIWLIGALGGYVRQVYIRHTSKNLIPLILKDCKEYTIKDLWPDWLGPEYPVYICPNVYTSFAMSFSKAIVLPDVAMTQQERQFILMHEVQHLVNEDGTYMRVVQGLEILYWWFPPIYQLRPLMNLFYEVRVDMMVTRLFDTLTILDYGQALIHFSHLGSPRASRPEVRCHETSDQLDFAHKQQIEIRMNYLLKSRTQGLPTKLLPFILLIVVASLSSFLILSEHPFPLF